MRRLLVSCVALFIFLLPALAQQSTGEIVRAEYGNGYQWTDVTQRVRSLAADSRAFRVNDQTMGIYSQSPNGESLRVEIRDQYGNSRQLSFAQNDYVDLGRYMGAYQGAGRHPSRQRGDLQITSARYGSNYRTTDVTQLLNSSIQNGRLEMQVGPQTMGTDPAPNRSKTLIVHYTYNGRQGEATFRDGEYVRLPQQRYANEQYGEGTYGSRYGSNIQIVSAHYGNWNRNVDVTQRLQAQMRNGEIHMQVSDAAMGTDPAPGQSKTLRVEYMVNGQRQQAVVREGETLNLPEGSQASYYPGGTATQTVVCESSNGQRQYCPADTRGGVQLMRQISGSACRQGSTWGYDNRGIWVDNGCRAEFSVASNRAYGSGPTLVIPAGTQLSIRTNENIDSSQASEGQHFSGVMTEDVLDASRNVAIPRNSDVDLVIRSTEQNDLVLDVDSISVGGQRYVVSTADLERKGGSGIGANKRTATMVGGGALAGAIIGAIAGGGKGAAIGAAVGAGAGVGAQVLTRGKQVKVPAETVLTFQLDSDLPLAANPY